MSTRGDKEFTPSTKEGALKRQNGYCASCGTRIWKPGNAGAMWHKFGERAEAHHVRPVRANGTATVDNCVIVCRSCHYSAHQGGRWRDISIYEESADGSAPIYVSVEAIANEYPFYRFTPANIPELKEQNTP
jgi:hypothetical protein